MKFGDTIAAVATPRGMGGVALLRISGPRAVEIAEKVFFPRNGKKLSEIPVRTAVYGKIMEIGSDGEAYEVDDGIATVFYAPYTFTGENTVEIGCHGGILLTETVLTALIAAGARQAEAGEYTRRAFLNGKLGLSAAEALGNLLEAKTHAQLTLAHTGVGGRVEAECRKIYERLRDVLASIYVKIDYPDEDLEEMSAEDVHAALDSSIAELQTLADSYRTGHAVAEGIATVICGRPNVGKSSLYNRILGKEAAIVTEIEGTTRDVLSETAALGGVTLRLFDTAGLHETSDPVERIGVQRAKDALKEAELILAVFDASRAPDVEDLALMESLTMQNATVVAILNKADLGCAFAKTYSTRFEHTISISAKDGTGMQELCALVEDLFRAGSLDLRQDAVLTSARQHGTTLSALAALRRAKEALSASLPADIYCTDVECAMQAITELDGRSVTEDVVAQIFSHFCVGK